MNGGIRWTDSRHREHRETGDIGNTVSGTSGNHRNSARAFHPTDPIFKEATFRRRFRMSTRLFKRIREEVAAYDDYFIAKPDACGKLGFTSYQKCSAALRKRLVERM